MNAIGLYLTLRWCTPRLGRAASRRSAMETPSRGDGGQRRRQTRRRRNGINASLTTTKTRTRTTRTRAMIVMMHTVSTMRTKTTTTRRITSPTMTPSTTTPNSSAPSFYFFIAAPLSFATLECDSRRLPRGRRIRQRRMPINAERLG